ncbi:cytochrome o ubiquinol oxidase subunit IV [Buchnera aphidicola (Hyperomyzus lactucae)]|uniref:Cytochrome bo(3) ubiquinol oxidase subunit 4 n=1 Tax=Buchnera aphidicola (Hyperomyzus lactucae) TaxID=1241860 RepID=A0A4D6Y5C7_9GAMM|nr:cytochrome o ubiquinol oxidase subunit IV [Buchnera aphidicola]QCI21180.1 cytochrome o ubiquinol oxidase subunit IV [Buchnera aphidicola (Hyperomyzus lactucae)]
MYNFIKKNNNKEIQSYLLGFCFSIILTIVPFLLVIQKTFPSKLNYILVLVCSIIQIIVHFVYFLHLDFSSEMRWNLVTLLFVIIIIFIVVFGSIWIMYNLNHHVMYTVL